VVNNIRPNRAFLLPLSDVQLQRDEIVNMKVEG
jgi:hypothetical protein